MTSHGTVVPLYQPGEIDDPLTEVLRSGARRLLAQAVEAEAEAFLAAMKGLRLPDGRERVVRHGHGPERPVQTGIGPVPVRRVKLRDRGRDTILVQDERLRWPDTFSEGPDGTVYVTSSHIQDMSWFKPENSPRLATQLWRIEGTEARRP